VSTNVKASEQLEFRGVYTAGNPIQRPRNTAEVCEDFRVMPGGFLRLRSGRVLRSSGYPIGGTVLQIAPLVVPYYYGLLYGADSHIVQIVLANGTVVWEFMLVNCDPADAGPPYAIIDPANRVETIIGTYDGGFSATHQAAFVNVANRPVFYNGLGVRSATESKPPFSSFPAFQTDAQCSARYFGLDCYVPSGDGPVATHVAGDGHNNWLTSMKFYVGLWHRPTDHYSNGVISMQFYNPPAGGTGTVTVHELHRLSYAAHPAGGSTDSEESELYYVFYATIDGGQVPYLILNPTLDGPYAVPVTENSASLSIDPRSDTGFTLDLTHEMPTENFPPRPMRTLAMVNGRMYGALMPGGFDAGTETIIPHVFTYKPADRDLSAVVWSAAAGDNLGSDFLGDPLQSWPYSNIAYTPNTEAPVIVAPSPGTDQEKAIAVLVLTRSGAFFLQEQVDGIHEWSTISRVHGIGNPASLRATTYGTVWVTQRNQIVLLPIGSSTIQILSDEYQNLLDGKVLCADYILDPLALTDRYQVWMDNGKTVCHDFGLPSPGKAYSATNHDFTAATTTVDKAGRTHHILAKTNFFTHEWQPEGGIPTTDAGSEITGTYVRNWDDFGDADVRKELPMVDLIGDGDTAASLGSSPLTVEWYGDFEQVTDLNKKTVIGERTVQSTTNPTFRYKLAAANKFWYKLTFKLKGHSTENGGPASKYPALATEGNNARNFYGAVLRALWRLGVSENRA
jgi:hypothetical protein